MDQLTDEDFEGSALEDFQKATAARKRNAKLMDELNSMGQDPEISNARTDHLLVCLVSLGIIDKDDYVFIVKDWEVNLSRQLQSLRDRLAEIIAQRAEQARQQQKQIALPKKGIVLPGGGIHKVPDKED